MIFDKTRKLKILIVSAHPDDEVLGCGATIAKHVSLNHQVYSLTLTDGTKAREKKNQKTKERNNALKNCSKFLGFKILENLSGKFDDQNLDNVRLLEIIKIIEQAKNQVKPDIIYTHSMSDLNIDHRVVAEATFVAFRPISSANFSTIISYEIPSATDYGSRIIHPSFSPNFFVNIEKFWNKKIQALKIYDLEILNYPNSRSYKSIEALAITRGSQNGIKKAEAFEIVKTIHR